MRTRSGSMGALWLLSLGLVVVMASPASAAPKKKKKAVAAASAEAEAETEASSESKSVDALMEESATKKPKASSKQASDQEAAPSAVDAEEIAEPDAWERPPVEEEKPKAVAAPKVEEKLGDGNPYEIALAPGFGIKTGDADWSTIDPYSLGVGLRGGYEFDHHLYVGVGAVYYLGSSKDDAYIQRGGSVTGPISIKANYLLAYVEGGYNMWFGDVIFRPSLWLGMGFAFVDPHFILGGLKTVSDFMLAPGAGLFYTWDDWMIGGDVRYTWVTADGVAGLTLFGNIGLRFDM